MVKPEILHSCLDIWIGELQSIINGAKKFAEEHPKYAEFFNDCDSLEKEIAKLMRIRKDRDPQARLQEWIDEIEKLIANALHTSYKALAEFTEENIRVQTVMGMACSELEKKRGRILRILGREDDTNEFAMGHIRQILNGEVK